MTAADRPSVTDDARAEAEGRYSADTALSRMRREAFIAGWEAADRAETTTATTEDAAQVILDAYYDRDSKAMNPPALAAHMARRLHARGLLATARTRPTREQLIHVLRENDPDNYGGHNAADWYYEAQADAVLAVLDDQPTEAEAGARALEQAAEEIDWEWETFTAADGHTSIRQHGAAPSTLLRERAARLRGGGDQ